MILSVARNVSVNRSNVSSEVVVNGEVESSDSYSSSTAIRGANLPFLEFSVLAGIVFLEFGHEPLLFGAGKRIFHEIFPSTAATAFPTRKTISKSPHASTRANSHADSHSTAMSRATRA